MAINFNLPYHECDDGGEVNWEDGYTTGSLGETLERTGYCKECKKKIKEVWDYSCELIDE